MKKIHLLHSKIFVFILAAFPLFFIASCATVPRQTPPPKVVQVFPPQPIIQQVLPRNDVFHVVAPGETVWRISTMYDVAIDDVVRVNHIKDLQQLEVGQRLLIPDAAPIRPVITLYPSNKWKYIIIHHSATDVGDALTFDRAHTLRGFTRGLGYDFVIDNGSKGKVDGQIEVSPRWLKQLNGAHCKADNMNERGIGICIVGNFSEEKVTLKQMQSLVYLVNRLRNYYHIPLRNIMGHGQVSGAQTECPGTHFPWAEFYRRLNQAYASDSNTKP